MRPSARKLHYPLPQSDLAIGADSLSWYLARKSKGGKYVPFARYPEVNQVALTAEVRRRRETINGITAGWLAIAERPDSTKQYAACLRKCAAALLSLNPEEPK